MIQQVHLSVVQRDATAMAVDFVSSSGGNATGAGCSWGTSPANLAQTAAASTIEYPTIGRLHQALLTGLKPATRYWYACFDSEVRSAVYSFVNQQAARPAVVAVYADFGVDDGFGVDQINADFQDGAFDFVLHAGDW